MSKLSRINKKMDKENPGMVHTGESLWDMNVPRISSGVFTFDLLTGGGIPEGRFSIFHGVKSSGKTTHALRVAGAYQEQRPDQSVLLMDFEHAYDHEWTKNFIKDEDRFFVAQPDYGEQGVDMLKEYATADDIGLIIIDSLAMMIPTAEADADAGSDFMGLQARLINKMFRKIIPIVSQAKRSGKLITIILINQVRANLKATAFGAQTSKPGGFMQDHVASLDIKFYTKQYIKSKGVPVKSAHTFTLDKSKICVAKTSGEYSVALVNHNGFLTGEVDEVEPIIVYAKRSGVLQKNGGSWEFGGMTFPNLAEVKQVFSENKDLLDNLREATLEACLAGATGTEDEGEE